MFFFNVVLVVFMVVASWSCIPFLCISILLEYFIFWGRMKIIILLNHCEVLISLTLYRVSLVVVCNRVIISIKC